MEEIKNTMLQNKPYYVRTKDGRYVALGKWNRFITIVFNYNQKYKEADIRTAVINNGGGHSNHSKFWVWLSPEKQEPNGKIKDAIDNAFGSFDEFKKKFSEAAATRFGSGWAWLVSNKGQLEVTSSPNQDSPLMDNKTPLLGLDVWEHAYYLNYQNKRPDYVEAFFNIINWKKVNETFEGVASN